MTWGVAPSVDIQTVIDYDAAPDAAPVYLGVLGDALHVQVSTALYDRLRTSGAFAGIWAHDHSNPDIKAIMGVIPDEVLRHMAANQIMARLEHEI